MNHPPRRRQARASSAPSRYKAFTLGLGVGSIALWALAAPWSAVHGGPFRLGVIAFTALAFAGTLCTFPFEFRRETVVLSFSETVVVLGLAFCAPAAMAVGTVLGTLGAYSVRRLPRAKIAFNTVMFLAVAGVARLVLRATAGAGSVLQPHNWPAVFAAVTAACLFNTAAVIGAIWTHGGRLGPKSIAPMALSSALNVGIGGLGLLSAILLAVSPWTAALLIGAVVVVGVTIRNYTHLSQRYANLRLLYSFGADLTDVQSGPDVIRCVLDRSAALLNAERACLILPTPGAFLRIRIDAAGELQTERADLDQLESKVVLDAEGVVVGRSARHDLRTVLDAAGVLDLAAVPVTLQGGAVGALVVADRAGSVKSFDREDLRLLGALAAHASVALRNGQLVDQLTAEAANRAHQALHDPLTRLGNRLLFTERLKAALDAGEGPIIGVMLMDLDDFKEINDTLGHATGDAVLREVAERLKRVVAGRGTVARLGGDEFAVAVPGCTDPEQVLDLAHAIHREFDLPVEVDGVILEVRASLGVTVSPDHGADPNVLLQRADVAMYAAKKGRGGVEIYSPDKDHYSPRRLTLAADLRQDLDNRRIEVYFQPKADLASGRVTGFEALARWTHPTYGPIPPDEFIGIAEQSGMIAKLTRLVLANALRTTASWRARGFDVTIAVNLSARSLLDANLVDEIRMALRRTGLPAFALVLELTESSVMSDPGRSQEVLSELSALGCRLAIDDFGTGYSSLTRLKQLPVDEIKIDKSFVSHMTADSDDNAIVRSIIDLARNMGLVAVAEGVEDLETWDTLRDLGCQQVQGYYLCRPKPAGEAEVWLRTQYVSEYSLAAARHRGNAVVA